MKIKGKPALNAFVLPAAAASAAVLLGIAVSSCQLARLKRVSVAPEPVRVRVELAGEASDVSRRSYVGSVVSVREAVVSAVHGGTLEKLDVRKGQAVSSGQVIASVRAASIEKSYEVAVASLRQAEDGLERASKVYEGGGVSEVRMVELRTRLAQAVATAAAAENALEECKVLAPFSGRISQLLVEQGERVIPGQPVASIVGGGGLEVEIPVPESEIAGIRIGERAAVTFPALDTDPAGGKAVAAYVKSKDLVPDRLSHAYRCTLSLRNRPDELMDGMICKVRLERDGMRGIVVPADAVMIDDEGSYVWSVFGGAACKKRVLTGGFSGRGVVIREGLDAGDSLIVEGFSKVSGGMKVLPLR